MKKEITVVGSGSWGSALASLLTLCEHKVKILSRDPKVAKEINEQGKNSHYLPEAALPHGLTATTDAGEAFAGSEIVLFVIPTSAYRKVAKELRPHVPNNAVLVSCSKGIERGTELRMSQVLAENFPNHPLAVLSGPNHAEEVARQLATAAVIGSEDEELSVQLQSLFTAPWFRVYTCADVAGIELGGAIKNPYAIAAGAAAGLGLGDNAIAALVTRGLAEMVRIGQVLEGSPETFIGLSGVGDLMTTCYSDQSRNYRLGRDLGRGGTLAECTEKLGMVAEGVPNTQSLYEIARTHNIRTPLIDSIYAILYQDVPPQLALQQLLTRTPRAEDS